MGCGKFSERIIISFVYAYRIFFIQNFIAFAFSFFDTIFRGGSFLYICISTPFCLTRVIIVSLYIFGGLINVLRIMKTLHMESYNKREWLHTFIVTKNDSTNCNFFFEHAVFLNLTTSFSAATTFFVLSSGLAITFEDTM